LRRKKEKYIINKITFGKKKIKFTKSYCTRVSKKRKNHETTLFI